MIKNQSNEQLKYLLSKSIKFNKFYFLINLKIINKIEINFKI